MFRGFQSGRQWVNLVAFGDPHLATHNFEHWPSVRIRRIYCDLDSKLVESKIRPTTVYMY